MEERKSVWKSFSVPNWGPVLLLRAKKGKNIYRGVNMLQRKAGTSVSCNLGDTLVSLDLELFLLMMIKFCSSLLAHQWGRSCKTSADTPTFTHNHCQGLDLLYFKFVSGSIQHESKSYCHHSVFYSSSWLFAREFPQLMHNKILPYNMFWMSQITSYDIFWCRKQCFYISFTSFLFLNLL